MIDYSQMTPYLPVFVALAVMLLVVGGVRAGTEPARRWVAVLQTRSDHAFVQELGMDLPFPKLAAFVFLGAVFMAVMGYASTQSFVAALMMFLIVPGFPVAFYLNARTTRLEKIEEGLPTVLQQLASSMTTGSSIIQSLEQVSRLAPSPLDRELETIARQAREQKDLEVALTLARRRIRSQNFDMVALVLATALRQGGDVTASLQNLSEVFRELRRMQRKISTATSNGRMTMRMMTVVPFFIIGIAMYFQPDMVAQVTDSTTGIMALGFAAVLYIGALALGIYLMSVKV